MRLTQIIEALLFASDAPLSAADLSRVDERLDEDTVEAIIQELRAEYELSERSFQIYEVGGGFQLLTRPEFVSVLERYDSVPQPSRLSAPALEVLAIIAYRQPLGRAEIEDIRGVGSSGVLRTLQERHMVEPVGRGEGLGRPLLYGTTRKFLEHFGFRSLEDLPRPDELPIVLRDRTPVAMLPLDDDAATPPDVPPSTDPAPAAPDGAVSADTDAGAPQSSAVSDAVLDADDAHGEDDHDADAVPGADDAHGEDDYDSDAVPGADDAHGEDDHDSDVDYDSGAEPSANDSLDDIDYDSDAVLSADDSLDDVELVEHADAADVEPDGVVRER